MSYSTTLRTREYLSMGGNRDEPGRFISWLCERQPVYGYMLEGRIWDIGTIESYRRLQRELEPESGKST